MQNVYTRRVTVPKPKDDSVHIATELVLLERGYSTDEARIGLQFWRTGQPCTRQEIRWLAKASEEFIELHRDKLRVGTDLYKGTAYFWGYKYRFWMRGDAHGNGYKGVPIKKARQIIHGRFLDEGLELSGETERHDQIINEVFGMDEYNTK